MDLRYTFATASVKLAKETNDRVREERAERELSWVSEAKTKLDAASKLTQEVLKDPKNVDVRFSVAETYMKYASPEDGAKWYFSVLQVDPNHKPTHAALAQYYATRQPQTKDDLKQAEHHRAMASGAASPTGPTSFAPQINQPIQSPDSAPKGADK